MGVQRMEDARMFMTDTVEEAIELIQQKRAGLDKA